MKEDVLEQIVDDYLQTQGYFTRHNLKFKPDPAHPDYAGPKDRIASDIDVLGFNPALTGPAKVIAVSCKSNQDGFNAGARLKAVRDGKKIGRRPAWTNFRELWIPKWNEAFRNEIVRLTGQDSFSYRIAVTHLTGRDTRAESERQWFTDPKVNKSLDNCDFGFLTLEEMWKTIIAKPERTPEASEIGRLAQLLKAANLVEAGRRA